MHDYLKKSLSKQRVGTYEILANKAGEIRSAETLYKLNLLYSKELYVVLGGLEIVIRNEFHEKIKTFYKKDDWLSLRILQAKHQMQVDKAVEHVARETKKEYLIDDVVAQLNFGFWAHLCDRPYEQTLWKKSLYKCFPYLGKKPDRKDIESSLKVCLRLRNKIAHLEPIIKYEPTLIQDYRSILNLMYAICPKTQEWFENICDFENIWNNRFKETK